MENPENEKRLRRERQITEMEELYRTIIEKFRQRAEQWPTENREALEKNLQKLKETFDKVVEEFRKAWQIE